MPGPNDLDPTLSALAEGRRVFGRFVLVRALGRGTLGVVWMARDEAEKRDVELKFLPEVLARDLVAVADLKLEVERVRAVRHDVFQAIHEFHQDETHAAVSSEFVPGNTLGALCEVRLNGCFDAAELLPWLEPLAAAFTHAHEQLHVVHRALHPGHLVLTPGGRVKVLDFGIAHTLLEAAARHAGGVRSSAALTFASPQLATGGALPTPADDVYALGATLYDLLAGAPPISAETPGWLPMTQRRAVLNRWGAPIPAAWDTAIAACLADDPAARPPSVAELVKTLRAGVSGAPSPEPVWAKVEAPATVAPPLETPAPVRRAEVAPAAVQLGDKVGGPVPVTPLMMALPEVEAARAAAVQRAHHRGALVALLSIGLVVWIAREVADHALPPVLPGAPTPPPLRLAARTVPKSDAVPPVIAPEPEDPTPPPATPAPSPPPPATPPPATPQPATPMPATSAPPPPATPMPAIPAPPPAATPIPKPATPMPAIPAPATPMPATPKPATPIPATPIPPAATPPPSPLANGPRRVEPVPSLEPPKPGEPWTNSLGMPFVPVPKLPVLVAIWETRSRDFETFAKAIALHWKPSKDGADYPATEVSFLDATLFCEWLTTAEESAGRLKPGQHYRLPTDAEWSAAAGLPHENGATLRERDDAGDKSFLWGTAWPPPPIAGNFRGFNAANGAATGGANGDIYDGPAPVGSFAPNRNGLFDLAGNAAEMVSDLIAPELGLHATRGGSFRDADRRALRVRARGVGEDDHGRAAHLGFRVVLDTEVKN